MAYPQLRPEQQRAVDELGCGKILCGAAGSGKSLTSIAYYVKNHLPAALYIITTAKKRDSLEWDIECAKWALSTKTPSQAPVVIDSWNNIGKYVDVRDAFFIFDEQRLVGSGAWVKSFYKIAEKNKWILLSATPGDTWMDYVPVFRANGFIRNKTQFEREFVIYSRYTKYPKIDRYVGQGKLIRWRRKLLVEMPVPRHTVRHVEYVHCEYDKEALKQLGKTRFNPWTNRPMKNASEYYACVRRLLYSDTSRLRALESILRRSDRVLVYYSHDYELEALRGYFGRLRGIVAAEWNGHRHDPLPEGDRWAYLVQYNAGSEGWNCTTTDTVVFFSQSYSYRQTEQAMGRIDRINTPYTNLYYYFIRSDAGFERAITRCIKLKKNFSESAYERNNNGRMGS